MFAGLALPLYRLSSTQFIRHGLTHRVYDRNGVLEVQFLARQSPRLLPVLLDGALQVLRWGNRRGDNVALPCTLWTLQARIDAGLWKDAHAEEAVIPAALGLSGGIWFAVQTGIRALVAPDEHGEGHVYVIVEPSIGYYGRMTKAEWMPRLVEQTV